MIMNIMKEYFKAIQYNRPYRLRIFIILIFVILSFLVTLTPPYFTKKIVDDVLIAGNINLLNMLLLAMAGIFLLGVSVDFLHNYLSTVLLQRLSFDIKVGFYRHLLKLSLRFFTKYRSGEIIYRLFNDTDAIHSAISVTLINIFMNFLILFVVSGILIWMDWKLNWHQKAKCKIYFNKEI